MRVAVASGKGGTGKTTVAVNLAHVLSAEMPVQLLDCDVEEPNAHLFLQPTLYEMREVNTRVPIVPATVLLNLFCSHSCPVKDNVMGNPHLPYQFHCQLEVIQTKGCVRSGALARNAGEESL